MKLTTRQRATSEDQKLLRRKSVLQAAKKLFSSSGFFDVSMSNIAKEAGVAKGTVYLYFETKEEIFLTLALEELSSWFCHVEKELVATTGELSNTQFLEIIRGALQGRDSMYELVSLLHSVLEKNVSFEQAVSFKKELLTQIEKLSPLIEARLLYLKDGQGAEVLTQFYALMLGWVQMTQRSPILDEVLTIPELEAFKHDREAALFRSMSLILDGFKVQG
ncbi:TetR family transcriptional regulator [Sneathiella limimaris]|uniref:TetR family transcriptional regulator n=1 Tax=Sneathiella limimaris TaxID=1964213 RepID=UPI00146A3B03|nr:TetR family transcriptional regulator [Sneathiella limimaris]